MTIPDSNPYQALPPLASAASQARYEIALDLAQRCPSALVKECVLTGSSSHGVADQSLALHERLVRDTHNALRVLFALNRQWEPDWKWIRHATANLTVKPERLVERINEIFTLPDLERSVATCQKLIYDTLLLASSSYDVGRAIRIIEESLRLHSVIE